MRIKNQGLLYDQMDWEDAQRLITEINATTGWRVDSVAFHGTDIATAPCYLRATYGSIVLPYQPHVPDTEPVQLSAVPVAGGGSFATLPGLPWTPVEPEWFDRGGGPTYFPSLAADGTPTPWGYRIFEDIDCPEHWRVVRAIAAGEPVTQEMWQAMGGGDIADSASNWDGWGRV